MNNTFSGNEIAAHDPHLMDERKGVYSLLRNNLR